jgi:hypothetical protein
MTIFIFLGGVRHGVYNREGSRGKMGAGIRMVTLYCKEGRIVGVVKKGNMWLIPADAPKPEDRRRKKASIQAEQEAAAGRYNDVYEPSQQEDHWPFQSLYENKDLFAEIVKHFPYPMHICAPDGTMLLANEAYLKFAKISNPERLYKKHNILQNSNLERWGIKDFTVRAFQEKLCTPSMSRCRIRRSFIVWEMIRR